MLFNTSVENGISKDRVKTKYLISPVIDFVLLGGVSIILFPFFNYFYDSGSSFYKILVLIVAYSLVYPHFFYSYQLLYQDFFKKISGKMNPKLQIQYLLVSLVLPLVLFCICAYCFLQQATLLFSDLVNFTLLITGWHYLKQGFGIFIITSLYQKIYYTPYERKIILLTTHCLWIYSWIVLNSHDYGIFWNAFPYHFHTLKFPVFIQSLFLFLVCMSLLLVILMFIKKYFQESTFPPLNSLVAYITPISLWMAYMYYYPNSYVFGSLLLVVSAAHSIQYITIVFLMKKNEYSTKKFPTFNFVMFALLGFLLGYTGFILIPGQLDYHLHIPVTQDSIFFMILFSVFINIHHFFIDFIIWRKESTQTKKFLFDVINH